MTLTKMTHAEAVEFDHDVLAELCLTHGRHSEQIIAETLTAVEHLLQLAEIQVRNQEHSGLGRTCRDLADLSTFIGMRTLTQATRAVLDCLGSDNAAALAACTQRMVRLGQPDSIEHWTVRHNTVA